MRHMLLAFALLLFSYVSAQDQWTKIFRTDPYLSNGYFIVNADDWQQMDLSHIDIDIIMATLMPDGSTQKTTLQSFSITDNFYGKADLGFLDSIQDDQRAYYKLTAYDRNGGVVITYEGLPENPQPAWPEVCRQTCNANSYAWSLRLFSDGGQSYIALQDATANGTYLYFYVKQSDWAQFMSQYTPEDFGLPSISEGWNAFFGQGSLVGDEVLHYDNTPLPADAHDMEGYNIADDGIVGGYAIAKHMGTWAGQSISTNTIQTGGGSLCLGGDLLRQLFNADPLVQYTLGQYDLPPVTCAGMPISGSGGVWNAGSFFCTAVTVISETDQEGNTDILGWVESVAMCTMGPDLGLEPVSSVVVHHWDAGHKTPVLSIPIPDGKDPKLVPVPKTVLDPGLYEFTITMDDGSVLHHYEDFSSPLVINADFADFTDINIYPVPVKDSFSADFDLLAPMDIDMTVVDNMGHTYYQKMLHFTIAGRNKEVVQMDPQWPTGLYHAIFQYADGSSESLNFTVAAE